MTDQPRSAARESTWKFGTERRFDAFIDHLGAKSKSVAQRHVEHCEADAARGYGGHWKRLAGSLGVLAPWAIEIAGQAVKFHIPDGKYRQQVFALEDSPKGILTLYLPDVLARALETKILAPHPGGSEGVSTFEVVGEKGRLLEVELLSADSKDLNSGKAMVGWGKRALRTRISALAPEEELAILEKLAALAAEGWNVPSP